MAQNFIECDREQLLLMSPSLREWLPENHLAWFVIDAVKDIDLSPFYARYRQDGWGRAAYDPAMMVAIVLYAYAKGQRSSRGIERACVEDVAYRVIAVEPRARSRDDQPLSLRPLRCAGRPVRQRAHLVRAGGDGQGRHDRRRRHEGSCEREP